MRKIKEYKFISGLSADKFENDVKAALKDGWELFGAHCTARSESMAFSSSTYSIRDNKTVQHSREMVKYEED